jgi:hypothetical protein
MKCRSAGYDCCCCLSWCACRAVVGVIVRQAIVLCDGIPRYKLLVVHNEYPGGAVNAKDPVFGVTPGPAHRMAQ